MNVIVLLAVILFALMVIVGGKQEYGHFFLYSSTLVCSLSPSFNDKP